MTWGGLMLSCLLSLVSIPQLQAVEYPLRWRWSNPAPHGNNLFDMAYSPALNLAVQVTERGQLYTSSDLRLWTPRNSGTFLSLRGVTFFGNNPVRIVVTGENGTVLHATSVDLFNPGTLLDGSTGDWLEAVTASPSLLVAVGDNGAIYTSGNGAFWKRQSPVPAITTWLRGVAFGTNTFVAVGENGFIARSPNGTNWTQVLSGTLAHLNRVSFGNNRFTAVGEGGVSLSSTNAGATWQLDASGATGDLFNAANGTAARLLVGDSEVWLQENGLWSDELLKAQAPTPWTYFANLARQDYFLIGGRTGLMAEGFKTNSNPYFWLPGDRSIRHWLFDMTCATNLYVTVGDRATVMTSGNGVEWNLELVPDFVTNSIFLGIGGTTNLLVTVGNAGSLIVSPNLQTNLSVLVTNSSGGVTVSNYTASTLGVLWHAIEPRPAAVDLQGVAFGAGLYVVSGDNGAILTSPNGTNWTLRTTPTIKLLSSVAAWPGGLVATGDDGAIITSPNGVNWTLRSSNTTNWLYKVRFLAGSLVAVGQNGTLLTSPDGVTWTPRASGTSAWLNDATEIEDTLFVVGTSGTVLTSTNLTHWIARDTITRKALYAAASNASQLVVAGIEGIILRSQILPDLTPIQFLSYARVTSTNTPNLIQNIYLFGGKPDQRFTLDRRANLDAAPWTTGVILEFSASDGTLFYLEHIPAASAPPQEYYEGTLLP